MSEDHFKYQDTFDGAVEFLKEETELKVDGAHGIPDPVVDGCWLVHLPYGHAKVVGCSVLIWLFGAPMSPLNMPNFEVFPYQPHVNPDYPMIDFEISSSGKLSVFRSWIVLPGCGKIPI